MIIQKQKLTFLNSEGIALSGLLESPANPRGYALFAHCFTCGKGLNSASHISHALAEEGFAVLRFDFTGLGGSDGDFANTNFSSNVEDLQAAADYLAHHYQPPSLLVGHSLGGTAALVAALKLDSVKCVATLGAPAQPEHILKQFRADVQNIKTQGEAQVILAGRQFSIKKQFIEDVEQYRMNEKLRSLNKALLVLHSPRDTVVSVNQAELLYTAARHPKSFISLDPADHLLSNAVDARYAAECIATWAARYLPVIAPAASHNTVPESGDVQVSVLEGDFLCHVRTSDHQWVSDEPPASGGEGKGPTPYDLLLAALGTCTSMTMRMYARRKKIRLTHLVITLRHSRKYSEDCETCIDGRYIADYIQREIHIEGELTPENLSRLEAIADQCPVHKTLHNHINIITRLKKVN